MKKKNKKKIKKKLRKLKNKKTPKLRKKKVKKFKKRRIIRSKKRTKIPRKTIRKKTVDTSLFEIRSHLHYFVGYVVPALTDPL